MRSDVQKFATTFKVKFAPKSIRLLLNTEELQTQVLGTTALQTNQLKHA